MSILKLSRTICSTNITGNCYLWGSLSRRLNLLRPKPLAKMKSSNIVLVKQIVGEPSLSDFKIVEEELPPVGEGEILVETQFVGVDDYLWLFPVADGSVMPGEVVARVMESRHAEYKVGDQLMANYGWRTHLVATPEKLQNDLILGADNREVLRDLSSLPSSLVLGTLGVSGLTALFGFISILHPKTGETLVVTSAASAVGHTVGQLGKILGLKVIGFAGADDKVEWLKELGFDFAYNYKKINVTQALKESAPDGVDLYFENVGGRIGYDVFNSMKTYGRVSVCGAISTYHELGDPANPPMAPSIHFAIIGRELKVEGFTVLRFRTEYQAGVNKLLGYLKEGKIKYRETVTEGFKNLPAAYIELRKGRTMGRAIVKV